MKLRFPTLEDKDAVMTYRKEFLENGDSLDGTSNLFSHTHFEEWLQAITDNLQEETVREGLVPATTLLALSEEGVLIGMVNIRYQLNDYLFHYGGHIGYSVKKSERQKGYATEILALALEQCKKLKISNVLITCDKENIGSAKTIIKNGGILENEVSEGEEITQRYWIDLATN